MKKVLSVISALAILASFTACGDNTNDQKDDGSSKTTTAPKDDADVTTEAKDDSKGDGKKQKINVWSFTKEVPGMVTKFCELNPDFAAKYEIETTVIPTTNNEYTPALDKALMAGGKDAPDLYCAEAAFVLKYTQGEMSNYATPYKDLGLDVDSKIAEAKIADYAVKIGTNPSGDVVGLGFQATGGAYIYRRSIAKDVFGSDEQSVVEDKIGAGSNSWDKFLEAAKELKAKNYAILSGDGDLWHAVENSSDKGWIVDDKLHLDPKREIFMGYALLRQDSSKKNAFKAGFNVTEKQIVYIKDQQVLKVTFDDYKKIDYPDFCCNFETFTNDLFLECEILGELRSYQPGETASIKEVWEISGIEGSPEKFVEGFVSKL